MKSQVMTIVALVFVSCMSTCVVEAFGMQEATRIGKVTTVATLFDTRSLKSLGDLPEGTEVEIQQEYTDRNKTKWLIVTSNQTGDTIRGMVLQSKITLASPNDAAVSDSREVALPANPDEVFYLGMKVLRKMSLSYQNPTLSPYGLWANSRFWLFAAQGETKEKLQGALGIHEQTSRSTLSGPTFRSADRILRREEVEFVPEFARLITSTGAESSVSTFDDAARVDLNSWIRKWSSDQIPEFYPASKWNKESILLVVNCVTMDALWESPFDPDLTEEQPFTLKDGKSISVPMMTQVAPLKWWTDSNLAVDGVILPYEDSELSCIVLLPQPGANIESLIGSLNAKSLQACLDTATIEPVALTMPRLTVESSYSMVKMLDLNSILPANPDFSGMTQANVSLAEVFQTATITLDEAGTKAAAATGSEIVAAAPTQQEPKFFKADRPFLFVIMHMPSQCPVFISQIDRPEEPKSNRKE